MKTRLLLFLMAFSFANAQINVSEGFESGTIPAGWGSIGFTLYNNSTAACNGNFSFYGGLSASSTFRQLITSSYTSDGNQINVSFNYKRTVGSFVGISRIYYEVNGSGTWTEIINTSYFSTSCTPLNGYISPGVIPAGNTVKFRMQINRTSGDTTAYIDDFSAIQTPMPLYSTEYNFDNSLNNTLGTNPFTSSNTSFTTDRNAQSSSALTVSTNSTATIPVSLLPVSNYSRTVSVWYKTNTNSGYPGIFSYGAATNSQTFGVYLNPSGGPIFQGYANDYDFGGLYFDNTWQHLVVSYNGTLVKMYMNGVLIGTRNYTLNTGLSDFKLGNNTSVISFDDLKIYNYVLTDAEVTNLFTNNSLTSQNFNANNLEVGLYPNPVNDVLNIETREEILSVEVYALQGQKVLTSNQEQVNVSELPAGIYLVRIEDVNNNIATKKIIKN